MAQPAKVIRPLRSGQITIPSEFRKMLNITDQTLLRIVVVEGELRIRPVKVTETEAGSAWARELYDLFAPVRKEAARYSEDEVNDNIDRAIDAVRKRRRQRARRS